MMCFNVILCDLFSFLWSFDGSLIINNTLRCTSLIEHVLWLPCRKQIQVNRVCCKMHHDLCCVARANGSVCALATEASR